jgi:hypothetical protein
MFMLFMAGSSISSWLLCRNMRGHKNDHYVECSWSDYMRQEGWLFLALTLPIGVGGWFCIFMLLRSMCTIK